MIPMKVYEKFGIKAGHISPSFEAVEVKKDFREGKLDIRSINKLLKKSHKLMNKISPKKQPSKSPERR